MYIDKYEIQNKIKKCVVDNAIFSIKKYNFEDVYEIKLILKNKAIIYKNSNISDDDIKEVLINSISNKIIKDLFGGYEKLYEK